MLLWAVKNDHEAIVKLLLDQGANLEAEDDSIQTPLWWAAENGHEALVKQLFDKGAQPDRRCRF